MCQAAVYNCGHSVIRECGLPKKPAIPKPKMEGKWWNSAKLPVPAPNVACPGVSQPAVELDVPCYKCVTDEQAQVKHDNTQAANDKMRERHGAGNDSYMKSLTVGDNHDENGHFICNKPKNFVNLDLLGKKPWNKLETFDKVGKMRDAFGHIVDRPDITDEQKALQYESAICIAQRNGSLMPNEVGSLNSAYAGMSGRFLVVPEAPLSTASSAGSSSIDDFDFSAASVDTDTPLTDYFDYIKVNQADGSESAVNAATY